MNAQFRTPAPTATDGTDADARPVFDSERRILGLPVSAWPGVIAPLVTGAIMLGLWESVVRYYEIPHYILPGPLLIAQTFVADWGTLSQSLVVTLKITFAALFAAIIVGVALAILFNQSKWVEKSLLPYAIILQVTPVVSIAPLIIIWVGDINLSLLICAWIVAFFPILSNTVIGLRSADALGERAPQPFFDPAAQFGDVALQRTTARKQHLVCHQPGGGALEQDARPICSRPA